MNLNGGPRSRGVAAIKLREETREVGEEDKPELRRLGDNGEMDGQPLSPASRLFNQPNFDCCIVTIVGIGKKIDVNAVKSGLEVTMIRHPRFSSVLERTKSGNLKWVRTTVVLENHIVIPPLDTEQELTQDFVDDYTASLTRTPLDKSKPLWEIHLLNVKTREAEATAVFRMHHSLGDGISLMSLFLACTRRRDNPRLLPTIPEKKNEGAKKGGFPAVLGRVWLVLVMVWNTVVDALLFLATAFYLKDTETPVKGGSGIHLSPKRFVHVTLSLDDVKMVKGSVNATVNDVLLGITTAGLFTYLSGRYSKSGTEGRKNIPTNIRLRAAILTNIRPAPGIQVLADMLEKGKSDAEWGNRLGYVIVPLPVAMKKDPLDYVLAAKAIVDRKKRSYEAVFTYATAHFIVNFISLNLASWLSHRVLSNTTLSFSNVPGPLEEVEYLGHPISYIAPTVYGHPHALTIHFQSYTNKLKLVLAVDEATIPDPRQLCEDISDALTLIKNAALARR